MKLVRAIIIGIIIWTIGVSIYSLSFYVPILKDTELQANLFLFIGILPVVWLGTKLYYRKDSTIQGYWIGLVFFLTAAVLDAVITVPYLIIPNGGTYYSFFSALGFWLIGTVFIAMAVLYWYTKVASKKNTAIYSKK